MRRAARFFIRLYPARWCERYGDEFETLIEDSAPDWRATLDLLKGAIRMQLHVPAFPKLAVILSLTGLAAGFGVSTLVTPRYISTAELQTEYAMPAPTEGRVNLRDLVLQMEQEILSRTSLSRLIQEPRLDLYRSDRTHLPLLDVIDMMRQRDIRIRLETPGNSNVAFTISFSYSDPVKARDTVQALITRFVDGNRRAENTAAHVKRIRSVDQVDRLEARIAELEKRLGIKSPPPEPLETVVPAYTGIRMLVLDVPSLPTKPDYPNPYRFMAIGFGSGFILAVVIGVFRRTPPPIPFPAQTA
jgi:hypothetical protein